MKILFLAILSLVLLQPVQALEPGRYLISCKKAGEKGLPRRGYVLIVPKEGKPSMEVANSPLEDGNHSVKSIKVDSVMITEDEKSENFILQAKYTEIHEFVDVDGKKRELLTTYVLAMSFKGANGSGAELELNEAFGISLDAAIGRLPDPEPAK